MLKRIIAAAMGIVMLCSLPVGAKSREDFNVYTSRTENKIVKIEAEVQDSSCVAAVYLSDNTLFAAAPVIMKNSEGYTDITYPKENYTLRLFYNIGTDSFLTINSAEVKYLPEQTNTGDSENTDKPSSENGNTDKNQTEDNNKDSDVNKLPTAALIGSLAVVKEAGKILDDTGDEVISYIDVLYQGNEIRIKLEEDFCITETAEEFSDMKKRSVSELKEGDVLSFSANLSGSIYGIKLLFRAPDSDLVASEENADLFDMTDDGKLFGLVAGKPRDNILVLCDITGRADRNAYIAIEPDTSIYMYDAQKRSQRLSVSGAAEILKSEIPSIDIDDNDNITKWSEGCAHNYAYVRTYDGMVCDIVIYANYITK